MFQTTHLRPKLAERGVVLSVSQVYRLVVDKPERLSLKTLLALMDILGCGMEELVEPVAVAQPRHKRTASGETGEASIGSAAQARSRATR